MRLQEKEKERKTRMQKLTYKEYRGCKDILIIDLHNGYTIIAIKIWNKENQNYTVELRLKQNTVEKWMLIDQAETLTFDVNYRTINVAILKQVAILLNEGLFDYYIEEYEYELKCFERGNELYEDEGDKVHVK